MIREPSRAFNRWLVEYNQTGSQEAANRAMARFYLVEPLEVQFFSQTINEITSHILGVKQNHLKAVK